LPVNIVSVVQKLAASTRRRNAACQVRCDQRDHAPHRGDAIERQALARLFAGRRLLLGHHCHAVCIHALGQRAPAACGTLCAAAIWAPKRPDSAPMTSRRASRRFTSLDI
jgi:hypothetical protein